MDASNLGAPLGQILLQQQAITTDELESALVEQRAAPTDRLGELLESAGALDPIALGRALAAQLGLRFLERLDLERAPVELLGRIPPSFAQHHRLVPIGKAQGSITVALADPLDVEALEDLHQLLRLRVHTCVAPPQVIEEALHALYARQPLRAPRLKRGPQDSDQPDKDLRYQSSQGPVIDLVNNLLIEAADIGASDLHLEPGAEGLAVRRRIDGVLHDHAQLPRSYQDAIVARIKVMAQMDIAQKRRPQDGRIQRTISGKKIDVRVNLVPNVDGERVVMRILDASRSLKPLDALGLQVEQLRTVQALISQPQGLFLLSGPTGSGKTTTLYAALAHLNRRSINIMTVEDPVEYRLGGISQTQVHAKTEFGFNTVLKAFLRQDPDVLMVGEIRDDKTAQLALRASMTGHLVLSTVHTNSAPSAITRLLDLKVQPFALSESLLGVLAQRLVRRLCERCKSPRAPSEQEQRLLEASAVFDAPGCEHCRGAGFSGRMGIYELLTMTPALRHALCENPRDLPASSSALFIDGRARVLSGDTTLQEVLRVAPP